MRFFNNKQTMTLFDICCYNKSIIVFYGVSDLEKILFRKIVKAALVIVSPLTILLLLLFSKQPGIALTFFIGALLGTARLKIFWDYIACAINREETNKKVLSIIKYFGSLLLALGAAAFILFKSTALGLAMLLGLITIPMIVTGYSAIKGVALYRIHIRR